MQDLISEKEIEQAEEIVEKLLQMLNVEGDFKLSPGDEQLDLNINTKDTGMIIGYHGEVLESLQLILSLMVSKKTSRYIRISIEVDSYKKNRTEYLEKLADSAREKALAENKEQVLFSLKGWERKIIHLYLQNDESVTSESRGEGKERALVIKPGK